MVGRAYRDTSLERRRAAAESVDRHLALLHSILGAGDVDARVIDGSAVAVEVCLADTNTAHTAVRVGVLVAPADRPAVERLLAREGFRSAAPAGDATLLRLGGRGIRRPVHVLFESGDTGAEPRSTNAQAVRERSRRLMAAWCDPTSTMRREHHESRATRDVTESFEVQLFARGGGGASPSSRV